MVSYLVASICSGLSGSAHSACSSSVRAIYYQTQVNQLVDHAARTLKDGLFEYVGEDSARLGAACGYVLRAKQISLDTPLPYIDKTTLSVGVTGGSIRFRWDF